MAREMRNLGRIFTRFLGKTLLTAGIVSGVVATSLHASRPVPEDWKLSDEGFFYTHFDDADFKAREADFQKEIERQNNRADDYAKFYGEFYSKYGNTAATYIEKSMENMFEDTEYFECDGGRRSAICTSDKYDSNDFSLRDFRYTVDYKDARVIERMSGKLEYDRDDDFVAFLPKSFECADFTQVHSEANRVGEQLRCNIKGEYYDLYFRLRAKFTSPLFKDATTMSLMQQSSRFLNAISSDLMEIAKSNGTRNTDEIVARMTKTLNKIDTNLYGIEVVVKKPLLPQKVYEYLFADMLGDDIDNESFNRENQLSKTLYNSGVGYVHGGAMGYVWGNDRLDLRTKQGLHALIVAFRDASMIDSNVRAVSIKLTNRTKDGVNLGDAFSAILDRAKKFKDAKLRKEHGGRALNSIDEDLIKRYTIEVGILRARGSK